MSSPASPSAATEANLPRASLLSYFHTHMHPRPPAYSTLPTHTNDASSHSPLLTYAKRSDEEDPRDYDVWTGEHGLHGDVDGTLKNTAGWKFEDLFHVVIYALVILVLVMNIDVFMSRWGVGVGEWNGSGKGVGKDGGDVVQVKFCLASHETIAPGTQTWRFVPADSLAGCKTGILTLEGGVAEVTKLRLSDEVLVGGNYNAEGQNESGGKFLDEELIPDDVAEEGKLRQPVGNHMHAGFGGPWRRAG